MSENVHPLPSRKDLPPEIAALAVPADDPDEPTTVILNSNEEDLGTVYRELRLGIFIPAFLGWAVERALRVTRDHQVASAAVSAALAASVAVTGLHAVLDNNDRRAVLPSPSPLTVTVAPSTPTTTQPPPTPTRGPTRARTPVRPSPMNPPPARLPEPLRDTQTEERPRPRRPRPKSTPPSRTVGRPSTTAAPAISKTAEAVVEATDEATVEAGRDTADEPRETSAPPDASPPPSTAEPPAPTPDTPATAGRDCVIGVDLDPLLNVCVRL